MIPSYTALVIGPIYKTLSNARKTRELWGVSYLFSYIMRRLIEEINDIEKCCLPYHKKILVKGRGQGVGFFPDRLIFEGAIIDKILTAETKILNEIAEKTELKLEYIKNYIRIYALTYTMPQTIGHQEEEEAEKTSEDNNIVLAANKLLDTIELTEKHYKKDIDKINWKSAIDKINGRLFYKEAFEKNEKDRFLFPSIVEIATDDFRQKNEKEYDMLVKRHLNNKEQKTEDEEKKDQSTFLKAFKDNPAFLPINLRPYHKYIVVVQADGDNIGKTIGKIGYNTKAIRDFSSALFEFALAAQQKIKDYGGKAVYIGGDDLLFFAPVAVYSEGNNGPGLRSIFGLINDLDKVFVDKIIKNDNLKNLYEEKGPLEDSKPSMSYGISITYSKYPLNEARDISLGLLQEVKQIKLPDRKNRSNFKLHKHSGHAFGFMIDKNLSNHAAPKSFDFFIKMVNNIPLQEKLLSSIIYKLGPLHKLLNTIAKEKDRLADFFDQEFELEKIRRKDNPLPVERAKLEFIENIYKYFYQLSIDFEEDNKPLPEMETDKSESNIAKLYSTLRFMKHLTDKDDE